MSGPYRFQGDSTRSPLDPPPQNVFQQPPSFKTNVNRMKTKKWVEAKKNAYDGDDWGEYDEFDEYGAGEAPPRAIPPAGLRQGHEEPSRSFTDPTRQPASQIGRRNSFETGEEYRSFSASHSGYGTPPAVNPYGAPLQPGNREASGGGSDNSDTPYHRRDFSPSAMPPPLHTRMSPPPSMVSPSAMSPSSPSSANKPLPFVRPADIYKRVEEERQRERSSMESSRPSMDSQASRPDNTSIHGPDEIRSPGTPNRNLKPLETVTERKSEYLPDFNAAQHTQPEADSSKPAEVPGKLAQHRLSAFDNDFWSSGPQLDAPTNQPQNALRSDEPALLHVVDQAFTRPEPDDQRSMPPTPMSKEADSEVSRSNTTSTIGISPIMSRVPGPATAGLKNRGNAGEGSTPMITEETSESSTPVTRPTSAAVHTNSYNFPRVPSPGHSRNESGPSLPGLATPTRGDSPARSPALEPHESVPEPKSALLSSLDGPTDSYATREADIASAAQMSPERAVPDLGAAERDAQRTFLDSHDDAHSPAPRSRSESPSKGRVQALAGKFGDVAHSRRGSTQSNMSRNSIQSWERSPNNSRPTSPIKPDPSSDRPAPTHNFSFRPKLPGQWESFATNAPTPSEKSEKDVLPASPGVEGDRTLSPLNETDLTPTTAKHSVPTIEPPQSPSTILADPLTALKAAGAAIGEAIQTTVGPGEASSDEDIKKEPVPEQGRYVEVGDVYLSRPLHFERTASSVASSMPPTPPAKDTPLFEHAPPPPPLKEKTPEPASSASSLSPQQQFLRPAMLPQLSSAPSENDSESDRLRKEIVASLTPVRSSESVGQDSRMSLQPDSSAANRESSILPSEYDSYWSDREQLSPESPHEQDRGIVEHSPSEFRRPSATSDVEPPKPAILTRFSWENSNNLASSEGDAESGAVAGPATDSQHEHNTATPTIQTPAGESVPASPAAFPDPYFGPGHAVAATNQEPFASSEVAVHSPTPPRDHDSAKSATHAEPKTLKEASPVSGLHIVNLASNPEAVDMPPRLSVDAPRSHEPAEYNQVKPVVNLPKPEDESSKASEPPPPVYHSHPAVIPEPAAKSPTDKPLGFREILNIQSSAERIATYNSTREHWAHTDHGLSNWLGSSLTSNPELASQPLHAQAPTHTPARHRATGSLSLFGKHHAPSSSKVYEQQSPTGAASSSAALAESYTSGLGNRSSSFQMQQTKGQMQAKGKDLLHTADILSKKGMTGAKGLFAKGKSRFRGSSDKDPSQAQFQSQDSTPSSSRQTSRQASRQTSRQTSREPSLGPEFGDTTFVPLPPPPPLDSFEPGPTSHPTPSTSQAVTSHPVTPKETGKQKKKRRLSSPFHSLSSRASRASASRSRPNSTVLSRPSSTVFPFGIDLGLGAPVALDADSSSPFHGRSSRASASRSRPNSSAFPFGIDLGIETSPSGAPLALPGPTTLTASPSDFRASPAGSRTTTPSASWSTPPRDAARPYSYHAPEEWDIISDPRYWGTPSPGEFRPPPGANLLPGQSVGLGNLGNGLSTERLGVLPSPAKSAFEQEKEMNEMDGVDDDIPPVPELPEGFKEEVERGRRGEGMQPHGDDSMDHLGSGLDSTERLGVLPSPAKSAFEQQQEMNEMDGIPPVPALPEGFKKEVERGRRARRESVIRSVVEYSRVVSKEEGEGQGTVQAEVSDPAPVLGDGVKELGSELGSEREEEVESLPPGTPQENSKEEGEDQGTIAKSEVPDAVLEDGMKELGSERKEDVERLPPGNRQEMSDADKGAQGNIVQALPDKSGVAESKGSEESDGTSQIQYVKVMNTDEGAREEDDPVLEEKLEVAESDQTEDEDGRTQDEDDRGLTTRPEPIADAQKGSQEVAAPAVQHKLDQIDHDQFDDGNNPSPEPGQDRANNPPALTLKTTSGNMNTATSAANATHNSATSGLQTPGSVQIVTITPNGTKREKPDAVNSSYFFPELTLETETSDKGPDTAKRPAYETMTIGEGDVSPISSDAVDLEQKQMSTKIPTVEFPTTTTTTTIKQHGDVPLDLARLDSELAPNAEVAANLTPLRERLTAPRLSASSSYVVHAVQYVPSHSSFESWEQESVVAPSQSEGSQLGDRHEEPEHEIPPVPQIPSLTLHDDERVGQGAASVHDSSTSTTQDNHPREDPSQKMWHRHAQDQSTGGAAAMSGGDLKHSQSLLSAISSAVSADGTQISPVSSQTGNTRPSSRTRHLQGSPTKVSPVRPHIPEDPYHQPTVPTVNDDYDLYADANGHVLVDGHKLNVTTTSVSPVSSASPPKPDPSPAKHYEPSDAPDDESTRYSIERPMSFISSPHDASGMPQDQINNTSTPGEGDVPPLPQMPHHHYQNGYVGSTLDGPQEVRQAPHSYQQPPHDTAHMQSDRYGPSPATSPRSNHGRMPHSDASPQAPNNALYNTQPGPSHGSINRPAIQDVRAQDGRYMGPIMENSQVDQPSRDPRSMTGGMSHMQEHQVPAQMPQQVFSQDARIQPQTSGQVPSLVDQSELDYRVRLQQATDPRLRDHHYPPTGMGHQPSSTPPGKVEDRASSRPKLPSVFKGLTGKNIQNDQRSSAQVDPRIDPHLQASECPMRSDSYQSTLGDLPTHQGILRKERRSSAAVPPGSRPISMVSHISHMSQDSTRVQAPGSRLDLRYPSSPPPFQGIPPQQPRPGVHPHPGFTQQQLPSSSRVPETGKKKRFSALGALFGLSSSPGHADSKTKLSREEKKVRKAQKHASVQPIQPPPAQPWPLRPQESQSGNQPNVLPYGAPTRVFPATQGVPSHIMSSQMSPQGFAVQGPPAPQQYMRPQGYLQQPQLHASAQRPDPNESNVMSSPANWQAQQQRRQSAQQTFQPPNEPARPGGPTTDLSPAPAQRAMGQSPPPNGYYPPDSKPSVMEHEAHAVARSPQPPTQNVHQNIPSIQPPNNRRVSSPPINHVTHPVPVVSPRHVSSPIREPQYDTPRIPAAYNHVTGPYVSPGVEPPINNVWASPPTSAPNTTKSGHQHSDARMEPISPQVSAQSQMNPVQRTHSNSIASMVSSLSNSSPVVTPTQHPATQKLHQQRMSSITETTQPERPWNMNLPAGATEQEIVRARHHLYMEQQIAAMQLLQAERSGQSPSPHLSRHSQSTSPHPQFSPPQQPQQAPSNNPSNGFRELLPRNPTEQHHASARQHQGHQQQPSRHVSPQPPHPGHVSPEQSATPAAYPFPRSTAVSTPENPLADMLPPPPPPKIPHSPMRPAFPASQPLSALDKEMGVSPREYSPEPPEEPLQPDYDAPPPEEPPPSYNTGIPSDLMEKGQPIERHRSPNTDIPSGLMDRDQPMDRHRPPNIVTNDNREHHPRQRQASLGLLQHPQPATMAASPLSPADMGADVLRRQLLQQEERDRKERIRRAEAERVEKDRERQERERARARARELEQSVSNGSVVGSMSVQQRAGGSVRGRGPPWETSGGTLGVPPRAVFELSAEEDDEPVMRATSFPGQEWVPTFIDD